MDKSCKNIEMFLDIFFGMFGVPILIISLIGFWNEYNLRNNTIETTAIVTDCMSNLTNNRGYDITVEYTVNNKKYKNNYIDYNYKQNGDEIQIRYKKNNFKKIYVNYTYNDYPAIFAFSFFGLGFSAPLLFAVVKQIIKIRKQRLRFLGELINAVFIRIECLTNYSVNGNRPYKIICEGNDPFTGEERIFESFSIWTELEQTINDRNIEYFPVYIDRKNPKRYYIALDEVIDDIVYSVYP